MDGWESEKLKGIGSNPGSGLEAPVEFLGGSPIPRGKDLEIKNLGHKEKLFWTLDGFGSSKDICKESLLKLDLPLIDNENKMLGTLWLIKDLNSDSINHYTLRRVEHLRRTVIDTLGKLEKDNVEL